MIEILPDLLLPEQELSFQASRSSGPGGQNVNKVSSRVTLRFDVAHSASLSPEQRARILERLTTRISNDGVLSVHSQRHRTQGANREAALERFVELLREALAELPTRVPTRLPRVAKARRLQEKRRHAQRKRERATVPDE
jgi:ribosome-associated protein